MIEGLSLVLRAAGGHLRKLAAISPDRERNDFLLRSPSPDDHQPGNHPFHQKIDLGSGRDTR